MKKMSSLVLVIAIMIGMLSVTTQALAKEYCYKCEAETLILVCDRDCHWYQCPFCFDIPSGVLGEDITTEAHYSLDVDKICDLCGYDPDSSAGIFVDSSKRFKDVPEGSWYKTAIDYVVTYNIMSGVNSTQMKPAANVTRAQFVKILANLDGADTSNNNKAKQLFDDVPAGKWYTAAVNWAKARNIADGVGDNKFNPDGYITREQMCKMLISFLDYKIIELGTGDDKTFADEEEISSWAKEYVHKCARTNIVEGIDGAFKPKSNATRAQIATIIMRVDSTYEIVNK